VEDARGGRTFSYASDKILVAMLGIHWSDFCDNHNSDGWSLALDAPVVHSLLNVLRELVATSAAVARVLLHGIQLELELQVDKRMTVGQNMRRIDLP
jgi:hypothetical protein